MEEELEIQKCFYTQAANAYIEQLGEEAANNHVRGVLKESLWELVDEFEISSEIIDHSPKFTAFRCDFVLCTPKELEDYVNMKIRKHMELVENLKNLPDSKE